MTRAVLLQAFLGLSVLMTIPALTAEEMARLSVDVTVEGYKQWKRGPEYANSKISEKYRLVTHVQSSGEPSDVNPRDPQFVQQQLAAAAQVQQALRESQARAGKPVPPVAGTQEAFIAQQQKMAEDLQEAQLACQGDVACLMKVSQAYALQSAMTSYPPSEALPAATTQDTQAPGEAAARYLDFYGYEGCPGEIHIVIDNTSEGATADVAGMVPFRQADTADYRGDELNLSMQCLASSLTYDLVAKKIYTSGIGTPIPRGSYRHWDSLHGETVNEGVNVTTSAQAWEWVTEQLRIADASGSAGTTLPLAGAEGGTAEDGSVTTGELNVKVTWSFEPI